VSLSKGWPAAAGLRLKFHANGASKAVILSGASLNNGVILSGASLNNDVILSGASLMRLSKDPE